MMAGSHCDCLVCRLERNLIVELGEERPREESSQFANFSGSVFQAFTSPLDLVRALHAPDDPKDSSTADAMLGELLKRNSSAQSPSLWQRLLLLVFIPTIHRTTSQITAAFHSLARDDTSQHLVSVFLEFLDSRDLETRRSHVAFTVARKLRRRGFRWAIREARGAAQEETEGLPAKDPDDVVAEVPLPAATLLGEFLDSCQDHGWLTLEERHLLLEFKIEGLSCHELASQNGHSAVAIQHRIQRLLDRLRRLARTTGRRVPEQLELFPR
jgi:hypothetical protein